MDEKMTESVLVPVKALRAIWNAARVIEDDLGDWDDESCLIDAWRIQDLVEAIAKHYPDADLPRRRNRRKVTA